MKMITSDKMAKRMVQGGRDTRCGNNGGWMSDQVGDVDNCRRCWGWRQGREEEEEEESEEDDRTEYKLGSGSILRSRSRSDSNRSSSDSPSKFSSSSSSLSSSCTMTCGERGRPKYGILEDEAVAHR